MREKQNLIPHGEGIFLPMITTSGIFVTAKNLMAGTINYPSAIVVTRASIMAMELIRLMQRFLRPLNSNINYSPGKISVNQ